jgi:hypothetical protein
MNESAVLNVPSVPRDSSPRADTKRPHIVLVVPRGEAVRNFLYSDTLRLLGKRARVTILSVVDDERFVARFQPHAESILPLANPPEPPVLAGVRMLTDNAHDRWLWSQVARNRWDIRWHECRSMGARLRRTAVRAAANVLANRPSLRVLTRLEQKLTLSLGQPGQFEELFRRIQPDLIFNCSHIHGPAGDLPCKVARNMGIPVAGFIFSWDNLTSRSRIFVPYDHYLVWNERMRDQLLGIYETVRPEQITVTGTPQFDFHFQPQFFLEREELCRRIGADPARPFILYTAGIDKHFPEEHLHMELVIKILNEMPAATRPQLVIRAYVKGTSPEVRAMRERGIPGVIFPPILWAEKWYTPLEEDLPIYTGLLRHCAAGINAASTVSLELMITDKPIINLGFDPPGSRLPHCHRFERHIWFDHFKPVAESGATMVTFSPEDMKKCLHRAIAEPQADSEHRRNFIRQFMGDTLDGRSGERVASTLLRLAGQAKEV